MNTQRTIRTLNMRTFTGNQEGERTLRTLLQEPARTKSSYSVGGLQIPGTSKILNNETSLWAIMRGDTMVLYQWETWEPRAPPTNLETALKVLWVHAVFVWAGTLWLTGLPLEKVKQNRFMLKWCHDWRLSIIAGKVTLSHGLILYL